MACGRHNEVALLSLSDYDYYTGLLVDPQMAGTSNSCAKKRKAGNAIRALGASSTKQVGPSVYNNNRHRYISIDDFANAQLVIYDSYKYFANDLRILFLSPYTYIFREAINNANRAIKSRVCVTMFLNAAQSLHLIS